MASNVARLVSIHSRDRTNVVDEEGVPQTRLSEPPHLLGRDQSVPRRTWQPERILPIPCFPLRARLQRRRVNLLVTNKRLLHSQGLPRIRSCCWNSLHEHVVSPAAARSSHATETARLLQRLAKCPASRTPPLPPANRICAVLIEVDVPVRALWAGRGQTEIVVVAPPPPWPPGTDPLRGR